MNMFISTLGVFDIELEGTSLLKDAGRSYKMLKLFQYFLTFRNKKILPDTIIENLWADHQSYNPHNMLRTQIHRLRQQMKNILPEGLEAEFYNNISFTNGYYSLDIGENVTIDVDEFEKLISLGDNNRLNDINSSIIYYEKALELYKGPYLEEITYELWLVPIKNYYTSLYTKTLLKLIDMLIDQEEHLKIIEICRKALFYEPLNENIHIYLMEALLKSGGTKDAVNHYDYVKSLLYSDTSKKLSSALIDVNRKIQNYLVEKSTTNITNIKLKLDEEKDQGPLYCDFNYFRLLFNMQKRKRNVKETNDIITLISLEEDLIEDELKQWGKSMTDVLKNSLRTGDVFTFWNEMQILILLKDVQDDGLVNIENRIINGLKNTTNNSTYDIELKSSSIMEQTSIL